ncbi:MAG: GIY-YIG nuclease family protein [Spirochaetales bacterium]|nr:GIY-YIG nuclease family protein [Spirochaetales bacterium]
MDRQPCTYILASKRNGTLYVGVTSNLVKRIWEHKNHLADGFTRKYFVHHLVYFELHENMYSAITREKQLKKWHRQWKINLIEKVNPQWRDLYPELVGEAGFPSPPSRGGALNSRE